MCRDHILCIENTFYIQGERGEDQGGGGGSAREHAEMSLFPFLFLLILRPTTMVAPTLHVRSERWCSRAAAGVRRPRGGGKITITITIIIIIIIIIIIVVVVVVVVVVVIIIIFIVVC